MDQATWAFFLEAIMNAVRILSDAERAGFRFVVMGNNLKVVGPSGLLTAEVIETLRSHKPALISELTRPERQRQKRAHLIVYQGGKA